MVTSFALERSIREYNHVVHIHDWKPWPIVLTIIFPERAQCAQSWCMAWCHGIALCAMRGRKPITVCKASLLITWHIHMALGAPGNRKTFEEFSWRNKIPNRQDMQVHLTIRIPKDVFWRVTSTDFTGKCLRCLCDSSSIMPHWPSHTLGVPCNFWRKQT